jgi:hypothetical protein
MFTGEPKVLLGHYAEGRPGAKVRFACLACGSSHDVDAAEVIWLLKALELGDERTALADSGRLDDHGCVRCGGVRWEVWPCPSSAG